ncbi:MAG: DUF393 domain-containing protein [bacterium]|nr:DUF393 domain-containing protein [bacterium]
MSTDTRDWMRTTAHPPQDTPVLIYDGDCSFCRRWVMRMRRVTGESIAYQPFQSAADQFPDIPLAQLQRAVHFIEPGGEISFGARAFLKPMRKDAGFGWLWLLYSAVPGLASVTERAYFLIAEHRPFFDRVMRWLWGRSDEPSSFLITRSIFLRALALVYLAAFLSLWPQVTALVGEDGILPARGYLRAAHDQLGASAYLMLPTLTWLNASDAALHGLCAAGVLCSAALLVGVAPGVMLACLWALYLSLCVAGQLFLRFQWDVLLLETGLLAIFFAPWVWRWRRGTEAPPSRGIRLLLWFLLFRLMFSSGMVKLLSGDPAWRNLTALHFHYETQPLTNPVAWWFFQAPMWFHEGTCLMVFAIELIVPFLIFTPRRMRMMGALVLIALQGMIILTGNYGFFNFLTMALCLLLIDDVYWRRISPTRWIRPFQRLDAPVREGRVKRMAVRVAFWILFPLALVQQVSLFAPSLEDLPVFDRAMRTASYFSAVNGYGLFAVMTTERLEIILEGSADGQTWRAYDFRWKVDNVDETPWYVAPDMPRVDWQLWFAALGDYRRNEWLLRLEEKLLRGDPAVLRFFTANPFPDRPPRYMRARLVDFRFTGWSEGWKTGRYWKSSEKGLYHPVLALPDRSDNDV